MREPFRHADTVGLAGATVSALCCVGVPAVLSLLVAVGLGFLIKDVVLVPLLIVSLLLIAWGQIAGWRRHRNTSVLVFAGGSAVALMFASLISPFAALAYAAIAGLVGASVFNTLLLRHHPGA